MNKRTAIAVAVITPLVLLLIASFALAGLRTRRGTDWIAGEIEDLLAAQLASGDLEIGGLEFGPSGVRLKDVRVHGAEQRDWLVVPRIEARVSWWSLIDGHIAIESLRVDGPRLTSTLDHVGGPTFVSNPSEGPTTWMPEGWTLDIDEVQLLDGAIDVPDVALDSLVGIGRLSMTTERVSVPELTLSWIQDAPELGTIVVQARAEVDRADLRSLSVTAESEGVVARVGGGASGALDELGPVDLGVVVSAGDAGLRRWASAFGASLPDQVSLGATLEGTLEGPPDDAFASLRAWKSVEPSLDRPAAAPLLVSSFAVSFESLTGRLMASAPRPTRIGDLGALDMGALSGDFDLSEPDPSASLRGTVTELDLPEDLPTLSGRLAVAYDDDRVDVDVDLRDLDGMERLVVRGAADLKGRTATMSEFRVSPLGDEVWRQREPSAVRWTDDGLAAVSLDLTSPRGSVALRADDLVYRPYDVDAEVVELDLGYVGGLAARFSSAELPEVSGTLDATLDCNRAANRPANRWQLAVDARDLSVGDGLRDLRARVGATLTDQELDVEGLVEGPEGALGELTASVPTKRTSATAFELACGDPTARATLRLSHGLDELGAIVTLPESVPREGAIDAEIDASGDPCDPRIRFDGTVATNLNGRRLRLGLDGTDADGDLTVLATLAGEGAERVRVDATARHVPLARIVEDGLGVDRALLDYDANGVVDGLPSQWLLSTLEGVVDGEFELRGSALRLDTTSGQLVLSPAASVEIEEELVARWETGADRVVEVRAGTRRDDDALTASIGLANDPPTLRGTLSRSRIPLRQAVGLAGDTLVDGAGSVELQGELGGTLYDPDVELSFEIDEGAFSITSTGVRYEDVRVRGHTDGVELVVDEATLTSRPRRRGLTRRSTGQQMSIEGSVAFGDGVIRPDLDITFDRTWLLATSEMTLRATGDAELTERDGRFLLTGKVTVVEGRFETDRTAFAEASETTLDPDIRFAGDGLPALEGTEDVDRDDELVPTSLSAIDLDLDVDLGDGLRVDAAFPLADTAERVTATTDADVALVLDGQLAVRQTRGELDLRGRLDVNGNVRLLTAQFTVSEGAVAFSGGDITSPQVDLQLVRETRAYGDVRVELSGTPDDLVISKLSASQYSDQADIVSILLLGRPLAELDPGGGATASDAVQSALLSVAGSQVSGVIGSGVVDAVDYNSTDGLSLGWKLGGQGFLTVSVDPLADADESTAEARLTWFISEHVEAGVETGDAGQGAAWIVWRDRF